MGSESVKNEMLQSAIAKELNVSPNNVEILTTSMKPGSNKGDNFASGIGAMTVKAIVKGHGEKEFNYICKYILKENNFTPMVREIVGLAQFEI